MGERAGFVAFFLFVFLSVIVLLQVFSMVQSDRFYHRLHGILHEEQPYTFLFAWPTFRLVDRRFKNVKIHNTGLNYLEWYVPRDEQR